MAKAAQAHSVLVVEDSRFFTTVLRRAFQARPGLAMVHAHNLAEARAILADPARPPFLAALVDLELPDASGGTAIETVTGAGLPAIVLAGAYSDEVRQSVLSRGVVDYVSKETPSNIDSMLAMLGRLARNVGVKVLVVDDSRATRLQLTALLESHRFRVLVANSGPDALAVVERNPDIRVAFVDYDMPGMDGCQLTRELRRQLPRDVLAVIGIAGHDSPLAAARMLKQGASDYLHKPFQPEELYGRLYQSIEAMERIEVLSGAGKALAEARQQAEEAVRFKAATTAMLTHELRTPLAAIDTCAEALQAGKAGERPEQHLAAIRDAARHLIRLSDDLADMADIESGRITPLRERLDLATLVGEVLSMVRPQAEAAGIKVSSKLGKLPEMRSDAGRVRQILVHLLSNSVKFTPAGGKVAVEAAADKFGGIEIVVADTGAGMTARQLRAAFDSFAESGGLAARKEKGWGLGLPIAKGLAEALGGTLTGSSEPGKGTVMRLSLPGAKKA